jgi:hypothetical protein
MKRLTAPTRFACLASVLLAGSVAAQRPLRTRCDAVQMRLVDETRAGSPHSYSDPATGKTYVLTDAVVADGRSMQDVYAESFVNAPGDTLWTVMSSVKPAAVDSLAAASARLHGRHIAVLIGDEVLQTAVVEGPLNKFVALRIGTSKAIADSLVLRVRQAIGVGCAAH